MDRALRVFTKNVNKIEALEIGTEINYLMSLIENESDSNTEKKNKRFNTSKTYSENHT